MEKKEIFKGVLYIAAGASSYAMLAIFVKLAYKEGFQTYEITTAQLIIGIIGMFLLTKLKKQKSKNISDKLKKGDFIKLALAGTSLGLTTLFYYLSVMYVSVSIAIVLLMQTIWMSVLLESLITRTFPSTRKVISVIIVLLGTVLTTNIIGDDVQIDYLGIFWGLMAAASFTTTMFASNRLATHLPVAKKSLIMLTGGFVAIMIFLSISYAGSFNFSIFYKWGLILALFGTIIPPLAFNSGFPKTGLGLGSIVSAMELPVSVIMAYLVLGEQINLVQFGGIILILSAIVIMNVKFSKK